MRINPAVSEESVDPPDFIQDLFTGEDCFWILHQQSQYPESRFVQFNRPVVGKHFVGTRVQAQMSVLEAITSSW